MTLAVCAAVMLFVPEPLCITLSPVPAVNVRVLVASLNAVNVFVAPIVGRHKSFVALAVGSVRTEATFTSDILTKLNEHTCAAVNVVEAVTFKIVPSSTNPALKNCWLVTSGPAAPRSGGVMFLASRKPPTAPHATATTTAIILFIYFFVLTDFGSTFLGSTPFNFSRVALYLSLTDGNLAFATFSDIGFNFVY